VLVSAAILCMGGWRQAPVPAQAAAHVTKASVTRIGTAVYQDRGDAVAQPR
jgi:hypothetical protein